MSDLTSDYRFLKQRIMDLLLEIGVSASISREVAIDVVRKITTETPLETIRTMIVDNLQLRDAKAATTLAEHFAQIQHQLSERDRKEGARSKAVHGERIIEGLLEDDEITTAELFFIEGFEGHIWRRKGRHRDTTSVELAEEEYFED